MTATKTARAVRTPGAAGQTATGEADPAPSAAGAPSEPLPEAKTTNTADLPNAIDIDAREIRAPVLTKQGWVCPDESERKPPDAYKP